MNWPQPGAYIEEEEKPEENPEAQTENSEDKTITLDQVGMILSKANELLDLVQELDPDAERKTKVQSGTLQGLIK